MHNSKGTKIVQCLALILCLGFQSKVLLANVQSNKNSETDSNDAKTNSINPAVIDEAFLIFLSEVDIQEGVEIGPLDMLDVNLEKNNKLLDIDIKTTEMKQVQETEKTKENK